MSIPKDTLTSKFSTLPYDDEKMQKMISLVQNAKGSTSLCNKEDKAHSLVAQGQRLVWNTIPL